ncbi:MAG: amidohydrolase family protein [Acidobacteriota bacterium]
MIRLDRALVVLAALIVLPAQAQLAVRGRMVHTLDGPPIQNGVVLCRDGKISRVGPADRVRIPAGYRVLEAEVVTPGLVDAHSVVGLAGWLNIGHDQDQLETSQVMAPELRAIDAYNAREPLIEWIRGFGVTTIHTGHAPGELISGQTLIAKTRGTTMEQAVIVPEAMVVATLGDSSLRSGKEAPGTRAKQVAMLRAKLIKAQEALAKKRSRRGKGDKGGRKLDLEVLMHVVDGKRPLLITANRLQDIMTALRLREEFGFRLVLDGAAEVYEVLPEIRRAGVPVIVHPTMARAHGERENLSMTTAAKLVEAGIPTALQAGYESYVPKTRVVLFEAAVALALGRDEGLDFEEALGLITRDAAEIIGVGDRVGTLERGKDADLALYDGDPFETTTHCIATVIEGEIVFEGQR